MGICVDCKDVIIRDMGPHRRPLYKCGARPIETHHKDYITGHSITIGYVFCQEYNKNGECGLYDQKDDKKIRMHILHWKEK